MKKLKTRPRKQPRQDRSRETVEALLQACAHILVRDGYEKASTNRVAERAGVSIGSLYQYYPSKEAIVASLIERQLEADRTLIVEHINSSKSRPFAERIELLVETLLKTFTTDPHLRKVLHEEVPRVGRLDRIYALKADIGKLLIDHIRSHPDPIKPKDLELAIFLLVNAVYAILHAVAIRATQGMSIQDLAPELTNLIMGYLVKDPPAAKLSSSWKTPEAVTEASI